MLDTSSESEDGRHVVRKARRTEDNNRDRSGICAVSAVSAQGTADTPRRVLQGVEPGRTESRRETRPRSSWRGNLEEQTAGPDEKRVVSRVVLSISRVEGVRDETLLLETKKNMNSVQLDFTDEQLMEKNKIAVRYSVVCDFYGEKTDEVLFLQNRSEPFYDKFRFYKYNPHYQQEKAAKNQAFWEKQHDRAASVLSKVQQRSNEESGHMVFHFMKAQRIDAQRTRK